MAKIYIRKLKVVSGKGQRLSKQDKIMLRNSLDNTMLSSLDRTRLDKTSLNWLKYGR